MSQAYLRTLEIENGQFRKEIVSLKAKVKKFEQVATPHSEDWLEAMILFFIGNPVVGTCQHTYSRGTETRTAPYKKDAPDKATIKQICNYLEINFPPRTHKDENDARGIYHRLKNLRNKGYIISSKENKPIPRGTYQITKKGKRRWKLISDENQFNRRVPSSGGLGFSIDEKLNMITIHAATADSYFYKRVIDDFDLMPKKRGRPRESVYFEGDKELALRLSHLIFLEICAFFDFKRGKFSRKTLEKGRELFGSDPNTSRLIRGPFK